ncbi:MAG: arginine repressor [Acutalibacteraceae bacterium]|nr:arginine repressor [Acutalibacteraceae bacterium]
MKKKRLELILQTIEQQDISTQEELLATLKNHGLDVTQATVSRDIKELGLIKSMGRNGKYKYSLPKTSDTDAVKSFHNIIAPSVLWVDYAMNTVVVKCYAGMAQAVCAAFDTMELNGVVGTLAGDDTIFVLCRNEELALELVHSVREMISK